MIKPINRGRRNLLRVAEQELSIEKFGDEELPYLERRPI
jgi:hypothetical protein